MDPNNPRPPSTRGKQMGLGQVQKWVLTIVATGVIGLHATAMAAAPMAYNSHAPGAKPGLLVISGIFGMIAVVAARLIHKKSAVTPLLILGWIPAAVFAVIYYA
jgi:hypothetical protein